jgi:hypothetical protein
MRITRASAFSIHRDNQIRNARNIAVVLAMLAALVGLGIFPTVRAETGTVEGQVFGLTCGDNVVPLAGATVVAVLLETGLTHQPIITGPDGSYNLTLPAGNYMLYIAAPLFENQTSYSVGVTSGSVMSRLNFYLYPVKTPYCPTVMFEKNLYTLVIYSNISVANLLFDSNRNMLNFTIGGPNETAGRFLVVTPRILIEGTPAVLVDDVQVESTFVEGAAYLFVQFEYSLGTHTVTVGGTTTVPELRYQLMEVASCVTLIVFLSTKRHRSDEVHGLAALLVLGRTTFVSRAT